jgi:RNA polymerase sigma-70 factor (ECF subfamily)
MPVGAARREARHLARGAVVLRPATAQSAVECELINRSRCGFAVRHASCAVEPGQVYKVQQERGLRRARAVWVVEAKDGLETGLVDEEVHLVDLVREGDMDSFPRLAAPYMKSLRFTVRAILDNPADVEEVAQETLLKAMAHLDQFNESQSFRAWFLRIAVNESLKRIRKNRAGAALLLPLEPEEDGDAPGPLGLLASPGASPADLLERKEVAAAVMGALDSLDAPYRRVFVLRDLQNLPAAQVAALVGANADAVNTRLHRARAQLRARLAALKRV